ncbi:MFS transporter [Dermabacteraceae bacterium P13147]
MTRDDTSKNAPQTTPSSSLPGLLPENGGRSARSAVRGGIWGNYVDQIHIFLPVVAIAPALSTLIGDGDKPGQIDPSFTAWVIAATLLGRPVGSLIFGRIADVTSRTATTQIAIAGTALCTLGMALLPPGPAAAVLLLLLRFLAGVFLAGEYSAAIPLAMEWSRPNRRGLFSGLIMAMAPWAQASIAGATLLGLWWLGPQQYAAWGWRVIFAAGAAGSLAMLFYYRRHVSDQPVAKPAGPRPGIRELFFGRLRCPFWLTFALMSGLWLMTQMVAILIVSRLRSDGGWDGETVSLIMLVASIGQALAMSVTGHLSTLTGRRGFFLGWAVLALLGGPLMWLLALQASTPLQAALAVLGLQVLTVPAYGPVGAYLNERFPRAVRATGYGAAYSTSIVLPALYVIYLPWIEAAVGRTAAPMLVIGAGALLMAIAAAFGPRLGRDEIDRSLDAVADASWRGESV